MKHIYTWGGILVVVFCFRRRGYSAGAAMKQVGDVHELWRALGIVDCRGAHPCESEFLSGRWRRWRSDSSACCLRCPGEM